VLHNGEKMCKRLRAVTWPSCKPSGTQTHADWTLYQSQWNLKKVYHKGSTRLARTL